MADERDIERLRDELEDYDEQLERRDREGEKAPSADATFDGWIIEHKDGSHVPRGVAERQARVYREMLGLDGLSPHPRGRYQWCPPQPWRTLRENQEAGLAFLRSRPPFGRMAHEPRRRSLLKRIWSRLRRVC
jgi:hypothetical protein